MKKIAIGILALGVLGAIAVFFLNDADRKSVAKVNGESIPQGEFTKFESQILAQQGVDTTTLDEESKKQIQTMVLDMLISQRLLTQGAKKANLEVTNEEVEAQFAAVKSQFPDEAAFQEILKTEELTEKEVKEQIEKDLLIQKYLDQELNLASIEVTDQEIAEAYKVVSATQEIGTLEEVKENIKEYVSGQKQQQLIAEFVQKLRTEAEVEILI